MKREGERERERYEERERESKSSIEGKALNLFDKATYLNNPTYQEGESCSL